MEFFNNFFTSNVGQNNFSSFGNIHIILLLIALVGSIYIIINKKENRAFELIIAGVLILQQASLYFWYFGSNYNILQEGLPLYHCRISILFVGLGMLFNNSKLIKIGSYWGIFGSTMALLFPSIDPFAFPHITQFSFFIGHIFLLWGCIYILFVKNIGMSTVDLKTILVFTNVYHILMFMLNSNLTSNYGYMNHPPISILNVLNPYVYSIGVIITFNLIIIIEYLLINKKTITGKSSSNTLSNILNA
ncbi:MAG: TIGR02206 family membrane protein [Peptostreptococcaceae bacterium]